MLAHSRAMYHRPILSSAGTHDQPRLDVSYLDPAGKLFARIMVLPRVFRVAQQF